MVVRELVVDWGIWSHLNLSKEISFFLNLLFLLLLSKSGLNGSLSFLELGNMTNISSGKFAREIVLHFINADFGLENRCW